MKWSVCSLNSARLNDSFVLSPTSKDFDPTPIKPKHQKQILPPKVALRENDQNGNNQKKDVKLIISSLSTSSIKTQENLPSFPSKGRESYARKISPKKFRNSLEQQNKAHSITPSLRQNLFFPKKAIFNNTKTPNTDKLSSHSRSSSHSPRSEGNDQEVTKQATKSDEYIRSLQRPNVFKSSDLSSKKTINPEVVALRSFNSEPIVRPPENDLVKNRIW